MAQLEQVTVNLRLDISLQPRLVFHFPLFVLFAHLKKFALQITILIKTLVQLGILVLMFLNPVHLSKLPHKYLPPSLGPLLP